VTAPSLPGGGPAGVDCAKLTSYFGERQRTADGRFTADALLDLYGRTSLAASVLLRGAGGFGARQRLRTDQLLTLSEDLPLIAVAVDTRSRIEEVAGPTARLIRSGLVTLEGARLLTYSPPGRRPDGDIPAVLAQPGMTQPGMTQPGMTQPGMTQPGMTQPVLAGEETKLTVYLGRQERAGRVPACLAVCDLLHRRGVAGATALLGVDGTVHGQRERAAFFSRNAGTPMMVIAVGAGPRIAGVLPELGGLLRRPLLTVERVRICKRDGQLISAPPGTEAGRAPLLHKFMVYTSESALHDGQPVHRAIVRRLRAAGLAGATVQRGVWGFHGDHRPHGDRLFQLGRRVPVVTVVLETPARSAAAFAIIDSATTETGLVTVEAVPAIRPPSHPLLGYTVARTARNRWC
jgi:PII-like signaling protein